MHSALLEHLARGQYSFLRPEPEEVRRVVPDAVRVLPDPHPIFLADESATPLIGFPVFRSPGLGNLEDALDQYLEIEEEAHLAYERRRSFDGRVYQSRWERYRNLLAQILENVTVGSLGQRYASVFWLHHSQIVARRLRAIPRRLLRRDLELGRQRGDALKYRIFLKLVDRVIALAYDVAHRVATEVEESEEALFPTLLGRMRDNVLILTEDHVSPDLSELSSYFAGHLQIDGRDLRRRLEAVRFWHRRAVESDPVLQSALGSLLQANEKSEVGHDPLIHLGYLTFLSRQPAYDPTRFPAEEQVAVWESLLLKLKEFEILHALRRMVVPLEREGEKLISRDRGTNATWVSGPPVLSISPATRPYDFTMPLVVDPLVHRYGLVYDISDFSATLTLLERAETSRIDQAFRMMFRFQRRVNRLAHDRHLKLEKYLGDGAFFSGRRARQMLIVAIHLQRIYRQALTEGFPFDRGLRLAMNYGHYRLLPLEDESGGATRYEFFGRGLVELSRLATGKTTREIGDVKTYLIAQGYPESTVNKFFAPLLRRSAELVDRGEEDRRFYAYINANQALINEGIVATEAFVERLGDYDELYVARRGRRAYIVLDLNDEADGNRLRLALRRLGVGKFKGLGGIPVYEAVDAASWDTAGFKRVRGQSLERALKRLSATSVTPTSAR